jgi:hypothetical protein
MSYNHYKLREIAEKLDNNNCNTIDVIRNIINFEDYVNRQQIVGNLTREEYNQYTENIKSLKNNEKLADEKLMTLVENTQKVKIYYETISQLARQIKEIEIKSYSLSEEIVAEEAKCNKEKNNDEKIKFVDDLYRIISVLNGKLEQVNLQFYI